VATRGSSNPGITFSPSPGVVYSGPGGGAFGRASGERADGLSPSATRKRGGGGGRDPVG